MRTSVVSVLQMGNIQKLRSADHVWLCYFKNESESTNYET